jgi:DNA ligase D-like protein (predicted ligase)
MKTMLPPHARKRAQPSWFSPMLATLVREPFSSDDWIFEAKLDGVRCLVFRNGKEVRLLSRNRKLLNAAYPELVAPFAAQKPQRYVADCEIVAFKDRITSFSRLQRRMQVRDAAEARRRGVKVFCYLFDLLYLNGYDLRRMPLHSRKPLLEESFHFRDPLRYSEHRAREGEAYYREACRKGLEGVIAKRADSTYVSRRSRDWLKFKCSVGQEFVIGGYTDPQGGRVGFGALLLGYYEDGKLTYAGKVGTGFDTHTLTQLGRKLSLLQVKRSPFSEEARALRGVHWVKPKLVGQVDFTEWTGDGKLRHPRFLGLRKDKSAREVVRERPT